MQSHRTPVDADHPIANLASLAPPPESARIRGVYNEKPGSLVMILVAIHSSRCVVIPVSRTSRGQQHNATFVS